MRCQACTGEIPGGARFCPSCGTAQTRSCPGCGGELPDGAAFCPHCGRAVDTDAAPAVADDPLARFIPDELLAKLQRAAAGSIEGERRRVTMLFCDVQGSTAAAEHLDPEEWADLMNGAFEHLIAPIYRYEGTLARLMGDAVLAFFGAPISHEDDPERAVRAGLEILAGIEPYRERVRRDWGIDLNVRIGINTGLVVVGAVGSDLRVEYTAMGDAVNVAARMEQTAQPGTVQVATATRSLVDTLFEFEDLGEVDVKGRAEQVGAHRVVRALERPDGRRGIEGLRAPLVGREAELAALRDQVNALAQTGTGAVVSVMGEAGLGKSRLVTELREGLEADGELSRLAWSEGRSLSYETATPFAPVREIVRRLAGRHPGTPGAGSYDELDQFVRTATPGRAADVTPFLATLLGLPLPDEQAARISFFGPDQLRSETFRAVTEMCEGAARQRPLVLVLEDLHWADSATIDLVAALLEVTERAPLLLLLAFRPRHDEPSWAIHEAAARDHPHLYRPIELAPLDDHATRTLIGALLDVDGLTDAARQTILAKAEGNPFFVEEVVRSLIDQGIVLREDGRWIATSEIEDLALPDVLSALVTTRLDQLDEPVKAVAQAASIFGREFAYDELAAVHGRPGSLDDDLLELQRRQFLREIARLPKRRFRFKHTLMQEAIYETVLLRSRAELHVAAAEFLERYQPERVEDLAEHLLRGRQAERAVPYLVAAGERALAAYALPEATQRLEQSLDLLEGTADAGLLRRALEALGRARELAFDFEAAAATYTRLRDEGQRRDDTSMWISGQNKLALLEGFVYGRRDEALAGLADSEERARSTPDDLGLVEACVAQCYLNTVVAEFDRVEYYMQEVSRLGNKLDDPVAYLFGQTHLTNTLVYLTQFDDALALAQKTLASAEEHGHLGFQADLLTFALPVCHLRNGEFPAAMAAIERGMEIAVRIGNREAETIAAAAQGQIATMRGDFEAALAAFRRAVAAADATGLPYLRAMGRCLSGTCYHQIGGPMLRRALDLHAETLELMGLPSGDVLATWLRGDMALCALDAGDVEMAATLADEALTRRSAVMHLRRPQALFAACRVALARGRPEEAGRYADELAAYVTERQMRDQQLTVELAQAAVAAAGGAHETALDHLDACAEIATAMGLERVRLDVHVHRARSLAALGRHDAAAEARTVATGLVGRIATSLHDPELRDAFVAGATTLLDPSEG